MSKRLTRTPNVNDVLTTEELASWFKKSPRTVDRMKLPTVSPGRYLFRHVLEELDKRKGAAA